jgi:hypothetical protein
MPILNKLWIRSVVQKCLPARGAFIAGTLLALFAVGANAAPRQILVCTGTGCSPSLESSARELVSGANNVPLFKALINAGDAEGIVSRTSQELLPDGAYAQAAHNHLVVIGLRSKDPLLDKIWGYTTTIDEEKKEFYAQGWGYLEGDLGWVECDRNPFLHSRKIKNAPEDTIIVKISGTSERGVLAALRAFKNGLLSGFVADGAVKRPKTTLLDQDPIGVPGPVSLPETVQLGDAPVFFAGWMQAPEERYRAILEAATLEPKRIFRAKYLASHILEEAPAVRWMGGVNRRAFGNAVDIVEFQTAAEAKEAAKKIASAPGFQEVGGGGGETMWQAPQLTDECLTKPRWQVSVLYSGRFLLLSTLSANASSEISNRLGRAP